VVLITHNPQHAFPIGNSFLLLKRGASLGHFEKRDIAVGELTRLMAGGDELEQLAEELEQAPTI
jgi:simple sugar transport system ATP-binding protein